MHQKEGNCIIPTICLCSRFYVSEREKLYHTYNMFMILNLCIRMRETVSYLQYVYILDLMHQKEGNCIIPTICLCSRFYVSERGKLYHTYNMFMFQILCIRKRETVSYLHYVYVLDFVYQKEGNCIIPTICLYSRLCVSERGKLYRTYNMFMFQILCIRKRETVSYLQYVYVLDFMHQKEGNCIIPTICLCSRFCVSERGKLYNTYNMFIFQTLCIRKRETVSYLQYVYVLDFVYQKEGNCIVPTICLCSRFMYQKEGNCIIPTICLYSILCVSKRGKLYHTSNLQTCL